MNAVNLTVEVHCLKPSWVNHERNQRFLNSKYRVYIDNELLTERTWIWNNSNLLQENIWIYARSNSTHTIILVPVLNNPGQAAFTLSNLTVVDQPFTSKQINDLTISFTL